MPTTNHATRSLKTLIAAAVEYEKIIAGVIYWRPDLDSGQLKQQINRLNERTSRSHYSCAVDCQQLARVGAPMPWEENHD